MPRTGDSGEMDLVKGCLKGNPSSQKQFYCLYKDKMMALCLRFARNGDDAEDIMQDGFIRVFRKLDTFKGLGSLEGWVRRVIVNTAIRYYHKSSKMYLVGLEGVEMNDTGVHIESQLAYEDLLNLIQKLPDGYRLVFNLYAIDGFSHKEIAKKLEISEGTSKSQLARGRAWLKNRISRSQELKKTEVTHEGSQAL